MGIKVLTFALSLFMLLLVLELIRREKLTFKYAFGWMIVSVMAILLVLCDQFLFSLANFFGFQLASNFIFFSILSVFVFLSLLMTIFLCQQNSRNDTIAQKIGMMQMELDKLKEKSKRNE
jgi:hypothetical protein